MPQPQRWWNQWNWQPTQTAFGPFYGGHTVQEAVYNTIQYWIAAYIAEVNRQIGEEVLRVPFEYHYRPSDRPWPHLPSAAILVTAKETAGEPERFQSATRATWDTEVAVFVYAGTDWQEAQALTFLYGTVVRSLLVQKSGLLGLPGTTTLWRGERYLEGELTSTRHSGLCQIDIQVTLDNAVSPDAGPPNELWAPTNTPFQPSLLPLPLPPEVQDVNIDITNTKE